MPRSHHYNKIDDRQRQKIIESIFNEGQTVAQTARRYGFPDSTVRSIAHAFETEGAMTVKQRGGSRYTFLTDDHIAWLKQELKNHPDLPVADLRNHLIECFPSQRPSSMTTVSHAVRNLAGYTLKLLRYEPEDYNSPERIRARLEWTQHFIDIGGSMMEVVYMDEAGFNLHSTRRFGRAERGKRAAVVRPTQKGRNVSMVVAVAREGIVASEIKLGAYNGGKYLEFVRDKVLPALQGPRIIVAGNVPFHKKQEVRKAIEDAGHTYLLLPPYSPHLNASEWVFGNVRTRVRREELRDHGSLVEAMQASVAAVTPEMCRGWIREVNRNFARANRGEALGRFYT